MIKEMTEVQVDGITVEGHIGTWYVLDNGIVLGKQYFLLESEVFGDEVPCIIVDNKYNLVVENVQDGWGDLLDHLAQ